jgi:hypothetical protein
MNVSTLVDFVRDITRERPQKTGKARASAEPALHVQFDGGVTGRLDPAAPRDRVWAEVLASLRDSREPAYVGIDPDTGYIVSLLLPRQFLVTAIRETESGDREVELEISHARHYLRRGLPDFDRMLETLESARREKVPVLITESLDSSAIVDARLAPLRAGARRG